MVESAVGLEPWWSQQSGYGGGGVRSQSRTVVVVESADGSVGSEGRNTERGGGRRDGESMGFEFM